MLKILNEKKVNPFDEGRQAFLNSGNEFEDCTYQTGSKQYQAWVEGFKFQSNQNNTKCNGTCECACNK